MTAETDEVETPAPQSRRRRALFWSGVAMLTVGLVLLGYVGWEFFGTNVVSRHKQQAVVKQLREEWTAAPDKAATGDGGSAGATTAEQGNIPVGKASALIRIPRFGSSYVVPVLEGTSDDVLAQGFAHFTGTAGPGQVGNYALAAHRVTHGEPLRNMPSLRPGDKIVVETRAAIYTYVLDTDPNQLVVPMTQTWVINPFPVNPNPGGVTPDPSRGKRLITLTTCSELFHTDNRMIAFGHLATVRDKF